MKLFNQIVIEDYEELESKIDFSKVMNDYYMKKREVVKLENFIESLDKNIEKTKKDISLTNITIDPFPNVSSSDNIGSGNGGFSTESYIEKNMVNAIENLERVLYKQSSKRLNYIIKKDKLKLDIIDTEMFLQMLSEENQEILKRKFCDNCTNVAIGIEMSMGESTVRKKIGEIEEMFGNFYTTYCMRGEV